MMFGFGASLADFEEAVYDHRIKATPIGDPTLFRVNGYILRLRQYHCVDPKDQDTLDISVYEVIGTYREKSAADAAKGLGDFDVGTSAGKGDIAAIRLFDKDGHEIASISDLALDAGDFFASKTSQDSLVRYEYSVAMLNGDLRARGSAAGESFEVGAGGTAKITASAGNDAVVVWHEKTIVYDGGKGQDTIEWSAAFGPTPMP
eukprot:gene62992-86160_t